MVNVGATSQNVRLARVIFWWKNTENAGLVLTDIRFLVNVTVTVTMEPAVMLLLSSSSRTETTRERRERQRPFSLDRRQGVCI